MKILRTKACLSLATYWDGNLTEPYAIHIFIETTNYFLFFAKLFHANGKTEYGFEQKSKEKLSSWWGFTYDERKHIDITNLSIEEIESLVFTDMVKQKLVGNPLISTSPWLISTFLAINSITKSTIK